MTLTTEDGTGVAGAESYSTIAAIDAYWAARTNRTEAALWAAATDAVKEGAAREATTYQDAEWGQYYRGVRAGYVQGRLWPRTGAKDDAGYDLPALPPELLEANCELAGRAVTAVLATDDAFGGQIKRKSIKGGPLSVDTEYADGATGKKRFGVVDGIMAPLLDGTQPGHASWMWA